MGLLIITAFDRILMSWPRRMPACYFHLAELTGYYMKVGSGLPSPTDGNWRSSSERPTSKPMVLYNGDLVKSGWMFLLNGTPLWVGFPEVKLRRLRTRVGLLWVPSEPGLAEVS